MGFELFLARINNRGSARKRVAYGRVDGEYMHEDEDSCRIREAPCVLYARLYVVSIDSCIKYSVV